MCQTSFHQWPKRLKNEVLPSQSIVQKSHISEQNSSLEETWHFYVTVHSVPIKYYLSKSRGVHYEKSL